MKPEPFTVSAVWNMLRPYWDSHGGASSWSPWLALSKSLRGEALDPAELQLWRDVTGRTTPRLEGYTRAYWAAARSTGKSTAGAGFNITFEAIRHARGSRRCDIVVVAQDWRRSSALLDVVRDMLEVTPFRDEVSKSGEVELEIGKARVIALPSASASLRGYHGPLVVLDELAHLRGAEGTFNDYALLQAAVPCVAPFNGKVIGISSPYIESGLLWDMKREHHGKDTDVLFMNAPTWVLNRTVTEAQARAEAGSDLDLLAEFEGRFRGNTKSLLDDATMSNIIGRHVEEGVTTGVTYFGAVDMSGGRKDSAALALARIEGSSTNRKVIVTRVVEVPAPFDAEATIRDFAEILKRARVFNPYMDAFAGDLFFQAFLRYGIRAQKTVMDQSGLYVSFAAQARGGRVVIPNDPTLIKQLRWLEEKRTPTKVNVSHAGPHDDVAAVCASAVHHALLASAVPGGIRRRPTSIGGYWHGTFPHGWNDTDITWKEGAPWAGVFRPEKDGLGRPIGRPVLYREGKPVTAAEDPEGVALLWREVLPPEEWATRIPELLKTKD